MDQQNEDAQDSTQSTLFKLHLSILVLSAVCLFGTFSPWITVGGIFNVSGNSSGWGITTFLTAITFFIYGLSGLLNHPLLAQQRELLRKVSIVVSAATFVALLYLLIRFFIAMNEYNQSITDSQLSLDNSDLGDFGAALDGVLKSLTEAVKPRVGIGYIACLICALIGLALSIVKIKPKNSVSD